MSEIKTEVKETEKERKARLEHCKKLKEQQDHQAFLKRNNGKFGNEATDMLYRLPLNDKQRKAVYESIIASQVPPTSVEGC